MDMLFPIALGLALAAVLLVLSLGLFNLLGASRSGEAELARAKRSNKLMQWRIILQGAALAILFLAFALASRS